MTINVYNNEIDKESIQRMYAAKIQQSFGKFARAITLRDVSVSVIPQQRGLQPAPAWSTDNGIVVTYDVNKGSVLAADNLLRLKGLVIHELSHLLYTPRSLTGLVKWVHANSYGSSFNILEDNRIENMMVAKMSGIAPWLVHTIATELLADGNQELLPLVWGRKYLDSNIRLLARTEWAKKYGSEHADEVCKYMDRYVQLNLGDTKSYTEAQEIIAAFHALCNLATPTSSFHGQNSSAPESNGEKPESRSEQAKVLKQVDMSEPEEDESDEMYEPSESDDTDDTPSLTKQLQRIADEAYAEVLEDVKNTISNVRGDDGTGEVHDSEDNRKNNVVTNMPSWSWRKIYPSAVSIQASRRFANELVNLKAEHDPGWLRKTSQGKVNVRQFMQGADFDEMFDQWSEGNQDVSDIECVVLVDSSGSMCDMMTAAYEAAWTIKRALDSINASTTVIQFADRGGWLYKADERAQAHIKTAPQGVGGSTYPFSSLKAAKEILNNSSRAIKLLLIVTDGAWGSPRSCDQLVASMRTSGVLTSLVFLTEPVENIPSYLRGVDGGMAVDGHKCEVVQHLTNPLKIVDVAKAITKRAQRALLV
jgi:hypothetical protein